MSEETDPTTQIKINKWDTTAVKNALDDAVRNIFIKKLQFHEDYKLIDTRLVLCAIAVGSAMFALVWDYLYPFPQSRSVLIYCVVFYFVMMAILTLYVTYIEKGIFVVAVERDPFHPDIKWEVSSNLPRYDDKYSLSVCRKEKTTTAHTNSFVKSVELFFDEEGSLVLTNLEREVTKLQANLAKKKTK